MLQGRDVLPHASGAGLQGLEGPRAVLSVCSSLSPASHWAGSLSIPLPPPSKVVEVLLSAAGVLAAAAGAESGRGRGDDDVALGGRSRSKADPGSLEIGVQEEGKLMMVLALLLQLMRYGDVHTPEISMR